ncbi:CHASE3 domain-containing protein [Rhizobium sp. RU36D]|uniref:sensor histidine kinase n=1 Tax=Rhizobium sp. RU36D TaxID=1907415 RepID=UPI0009D7B2F7|nr:CHASE3 domain-containing protein [Rhizobium sp. RU36D]SMD04769.1 sensor domain CHASE3-containing protein [Rhizobium sp. RU36D]
MAKDNISFARTTLLMLVVGASILAGLIVSSLWLVEQTRSTFSYIMEERQIRRTAADLLQNLVDAETGQRGFVLTGDATFLEPYSASLDDVHRNLERLVSEVKNRPSKEARMPDLTRLVGQKLAELDRSISLVKAGQRDDAVAIVRTGIGRDQMATIREILGYVRSQSDLNVEAGVNRQLEYSNQLQWFTIGGAVAIFLVVGGSIVIVMQHVRDLARAQKEVETLNAGLEARVAERTEDLIRANQEVQRFAYIVTHDLRAPLVNVMGFTAELDTALKSLQTYVLADGGSLTPEQIQNARLAASEDLPEAISFIRSSTRKMDGLINAILKISRDGRRQLKPEKIDLKELVEATSASVHHQIAETDGHVDIQVKKPSIISDKLSLEQILGNLFDNAVKYKHAERPLIMAVRVEPEGRQMVRIEVEDNGRGIAQEDHERIFELFRRAGQQDKVGEGIGLAHVRSLARNLGGEITVKSELGKGSTFVLRLPSDLSRIVRS